MIRSSCYLTRVNHETHEFDTMVNRSEHIIGLRNVDRELIRIRDLTWNVRLTFKCAGPILAGWQLDSINDGIMSTIKREDHFAKFAIGYITYHKI